MIQARQFGPDGDPIALFDATGEQATSHGHDLFGQLGVASDHAVLFYRSEPGKAP